MTEPTKKKTIPKVVRDLAWNKWVGEDVAKTKCFCCGVNEIRMNKFHCGHVVAEAKGGKTTVDNLRPICQACNLSMGTEDLFEFRKRCGFDEIPVVNPTPSSSVKTFIPHSQRPRAYFGEEPVPIQKSNDDESDTPVSWHTGILLTRTPKYLERPKGKPTLVNGRPIYLIDTSERQMELEIKSKYCYHSPGVYKRNY